MDSDDWFLGRPRPSRAPVALAPCRRTALDASRRGGGLSPLSSSRCPRIARLRLVARKPVSAVVVAVAPPLRLTPTREGEVLGKLPAGDIARVELTRGLYFYVRGEAGDRAGWVYCDEFTRIWAQ